MESNERANLRGLAMTLEPTTLIGKNGLTAPLIEQINQQLEAHELVKINVLKNAEFSAKDIIDDVAKKCKAEPVQAIGNKITLYRRSKRKDIVHIL